MPSYPGSIWAGHTAPATLAGPPTHETMHEDVSGELVAVQTELGTNPSGASATVAARFTAGELRVGGEWRRNVAQSIPDAVLTQIVWDTEVADPQGFATPPTNTITIPGGYGGVYTISVNVTGLGDPAVTQGTVRLVTSTGTGYTWDFPSNGFSGWAGGAGTLAMAPGDTIAVYAFQNSAGAADLIGHITVYRVAL